MIPQNKNAAPGGVRRLKASVDCGRREDFTSLSKQPQYPIASACAFMQAAGAWHRDEGMIRATTPAEARRSALVFAFAAAFLHRMAGADRLDRIFVPGVIAATTRHSRAARIVTAEAHTIAAQADAVAAQFVDSLQA